MHGATSPRCAHAQFQMSFIWVALLMGLGVGFSLGTYLVLAMVFGRAAPKAIELTRASVINMCFQNRIRNCSERSGINLALARSEVITVMAKIVARRAGHESIFSS